MTRFSRLPAPARSLMVVLVAALAYLLPYLGRVPVIGPQLVTEGIDWPSALFTMSYYVLLALGLNVVVGFAGLLDLGYVGFFAVGAYGVAVLTSPDSPVYQGFPWLVCVPVAIAATLVSGVVLGWPTLRLRGDYLAIVTLGFAEIIRVTAENSSLTRGDRGLSGIPAPPGAYPDGSPIFSVRDATPFYWLGLTVVLLAVVGVRNLQHSRVGRSWLAIREDEEVAETMGVRTVKFKLWAFAIGAALGGLSGFLFASRSAFIDPTQFNVNLSILFVAMVVIGGSGNMAGVALGAVLLTYLPERFRFMAEYRTLLFGVAMVVIMVMRPQGLIPSRRRARELADRAKEAPVNVVS